ncbi:MAG: OmpA family protein [Xanthomonadaceae bacterium]|jgi:OOP family OmpA-OmpF porin|nr:OmpA family protein [Xanthomonadaceae bacterium]
MNKKLLTAALLGGLAVAAQAASAQDFDDRWYLTSSVGFNVQDGDRKTDDTPFVTLGLGKFINRNWSLDGELNYQNPHNEDNHNLNWSQYGASIDVRRHFVRDGRGWNPYLLFGVGYQRSEEEFVIPSLDSPDKRKDGNVSAKVGIGLQTTFERRVAVRAEVAYRGDFDDQSKRAPNEDWFGDLLASVGVVVPLGPAPVAAVVVAPPPPPPPATNCADLDDDNDGINNCDDRCPNSKPGETIGPDGCAVQITIDLKGVNFDFDKSTLRPESPAILNEAVEILKRYPELRVEVAGHTDSVGTEVYNQGLSERRARTVYNYLVDHGIDSSRLIGPVGYGETHPLVPNDTREDRAKNRRTELNIQN